MLTENPFKQMAVIVFQTLFIFFVFSLLSKSEYQFVFDAVIFGFLLNSLIIIIYSLTYHSSAIGYGSLFDPITGDKLNTPHISNSLAIVFSYYIAKFFDEKNKFFIILYVLINVILVISAIVLAGRSFFVISSLSLFLCILFRKKSKSFTYLVIFSGTIIFILNIFSDTDFFNYVNFLFNRFENGLESTRTDLYSYGLSNVANYPLGGFTLNSSISNTLWFHNIFLDTASTSGWISLFFLIIFYIFPFFNSGIYYTRPQSIKYTVTFVSLFLVAQQDVIIEGNFKIFITTYAALICLHATRYIKTPSSNSFTNKLHTKFSES